MWCNGNSLSLNVSKTEELNIDFRKNGGEHGPVYINGTEVERVKSIRFLRLTITDDLSWTSTVKEVQQRLFFLRQHRKFGMSIRFLTNFYRYTIENVLSRCITAWFGNCSAQKRKKLQRIVCTAQTITEANLPFMDSIYKAHCDGKTAKIIKDPSHTNNDLLQPLLSGRRYRSLNTCLNRFRNSFFLAIIRLMNGPLGSMLISP
eukprot:g26280.t1